MVQFRSHIEIFHLQELYIVNFKVVLFNIIINIVVSWDQMIWLQCERSNSYIVAEISFGLGPGGAGGGCIRALPIFYGCLPLIEHTIKVHLRIVCNEH